MSTRVRRAALVVVLVLTTWTAVGAGTAYLATRPAPGHVPAREMIGGRAVLELSVSAADGVHSFAWFVDAGGDRCAVLLSGIHGDRRASLPRADFWLSRGWSVLLPDLRGTGESDAQPISFGWNERLDVEAWVEYLRERGLKKIALHGQSLGAAAAVYAAADGAQVELLVLDACYDNLRNALSRRLPWIPLPRVLFFPVRVFTQLRLGVSPELMQPVKCLARIRAPVFLASGSDDQKVGREAATALFEACAAERKILHWVAGAGHEELWLRDPAGLADALGRFITAAGLD